MLDQVDTENAGAGFSKEMGFSTIYVSLVSVGSLSRKKDESLILLRVQRQKERDICYRIGRSEPLGLAMLDYCERMGLVFDTVRFTYDRSRIRREHTAAELEMEDDHVIDAWSDKLGTGQGCMFI